MHARIDMQQQSQTANPPSEDLRNEIRETIRAAQQAAADAHKAQSDANQVRIQNGQPVPAIPAIPAIPPIPHIQVNPPSPADMIPPQAVDISIGFFVMCAVMVIGWPLARAFGKRLERSGAPAAVAPALAGQLERIEQAVDAMAIEVERISEAQRYLTKLQSAAAEPAALQAGERR
jgi:hypothetical protein